MNKRWASIFEIAIFLAVLIGPAVPPDDTNPVRRAVRPLQHTETIEVRATPHAWLPEHSMSAGPSLKQLRENSTPLFL